MKTIDIQVPDIFPPIRMKIYEDKDQFISPVLEKWGIWEPTETQLSLRYIKSGFNVLDIGANIGYYTLLFSRCVGATGRVYAFEPYPDNVLILQSNTLLNSASNVVISQMALSDETGEGCLYKADNDNADHRISFQQGRVSIPVKLTTVDDFFDSQYPTIHFVKIDTQGAEEKILRGMKQLIASNAQHLTIFMEFTPRLLEIMGSGYESFLCLLTELGARVMLYSATEEGKIEFNSAEIKDLESSAKYLLSLDFDTAVMYILLFFSCEAENNFLSTQQYGITTAKPGMLLL